MQTTAAISEKAPPAEEDVVHAAVAYLHARRRVLFRLLPLAAIASAACAVASVFGSKSAFAFGAVAACAVVAAVVVAVGARRDLRAHDAMVRAIVVERTSWNAPRTALLLALAAVFGVVVGVVPALFGRGAVASPDPIAARPPPRPERLVPRQHPGARPHSIPLGVRVLFTDLSPTSPCPRAAFYFYDVAVDDDGPNVRFDVINDGGAVCATEMSLGSASQPGATMGYRVDARETSSGFVVPIARDGATSLLVIGGRSGPAVTYSLDFKLREAELR